MATRKEIDYQALQEFVDHVEATIGEGSRLLSYEFTNGKLTGTAIAPNDDAFDVTWSIERKCYVNLPAT